MTAMKSNMSLDNFTLLSMLAGFLCGVSHPVTKAG